MELLRLGIVGEKVFSDLKHIGKIRNRFAHFIALPGKSGVSQPVSFQTNEIRDRCQNLELPNILRNPTINPDNPPKRPEDIELLPPTSDPRERFLETVKHIILGLHAEVFRDNNPDKTQPAYLIW